MKLEVLMRAGQSHVGGGGGRFMLEGRGPLRGEGTAKESL